MIRTNVNNVMFFHWRIGTNARSHEGHSGAVLTQILLCPEIFLLQYTYVDMHVIVILTRQN